MLPRRNLLGLRLIARLPTLRIGVHSLPGLLSLLLGGFRCIQRSGFVVGPHDWVLHRAARELPAAFIEMGTFEPRNRGLYRLSFNTMETKETIFQDRMETAFRDIAQCTRLSANPMTGAGCAKGQGDAHYQKRGHFPLWPGGGPTSLGSIPSAAIRARAACCAAS